MAKDHPSAPPPPSDGARQAREAKLAQALKANLKRRKARPAGGKD